MKTVIADTGAIISLAFIDGIELIEKVFGEFYLPEAVWEELNQYKHPNFPKEALNQLKSHVVGIKSANRLALMMDYGESESIILYEELEADYLIIDDKKARFLAESMGVNCVGSIGVLVEAKSKGLIQELKPIFQIWLKNERHFTISLLNSVLARFGEEFL